MKLTHNCPTCGKKAVIQSEFPLGSLINYVYRCGHLELRPKIQVEILDSNELNFNSNVSAVHNALSESKVST